MNYLYLVAIISVVLVCYVYGMKELREIEERAIEREKIFEKWMFDSLYSMNHNVKLPEVFEPKPETHKKPIVYSPERDPMAEFNGNKDDFHE